jgi:diacylglycerol kinase (ATP)
MPERLALVVNPVAGEGHALDRWPAVERVLAARGGEVVRVEPDGEHGMAAAIRAAAADGRTIVVAGGDGTVNRAVNALDRWDVPLGIVPVGSGNDLARALDLPADPVDAARRIAIGHPAPMDLVEVNGQRFCTVGGAGLLADVTMGVGRLALPGRPTRPPMRALGPQAYLLVAAAHLAAPWSHARTARVSGDGPDGRWTWEGECHAVLVANLPTLGAGLTLPVPARADDGIAEVCIVPKRSRVSLALRLASLRTGRPQPEHVLAIRRATTATIDLDAVSPFAADGDVLCQERHFELRLLPDAVRIIR